MLKICLVFWKSEPQYAYKRYAYKKKNMYYESKFLSKYKICSIISGNKKYILVQVDYIRFH